MADLPPNLGWSAFESLPAAAGESCVEAAGGRSSGFTSWRHAAASVEADIQLRR